MENKREERNVIEETTEPTLEAMNEGKGKGKAKENEKAQIVRKNRQQKFRNDAYHINI